jgi:PhoPQ-activated pathogenicity-related protein
MNTGMGTKGGSELMMTRSTMISGRYCRPVWLASLVFLATIQRPTPARADLPEYLRKPEPAFAWKLSEKIERDGDTVYDLRLVSQTWQAITWEHALQVYQPKGVKPAATLLLWNQGGRPNPGSMAFGLDLARRLQAPCAFLYGIPNQPLLGGKKEDALIAETFVRCLETKDENWPLLFPMVKSLVKAMDALQAFARQEWKTPVENFLVTPLISLRENAIAQEPGSSYLEPWRCVSRLGASRVA